MKRVISIVLLAVLVLSMVGCTILEKEKTDPVVESYRNSARRLMDAGNYEGAAEVLKEGIEQTGSEELNQMLEDVNRILRDRKTEATNPPVTEGPVTFPTEPPATQAPTQPVTNTPSGVNLADVQYRINLFLSNFAEAHFNTYPTTKYRMLSFAYTHAMLNQDGEIKYTAGEAYMSEEDINNVLYKYFGISYSKNGTPETYYLEPQYTYAYIRYDGDNYYYPVAAGESYSNVAIATEMTRNSDGTYNVKYDMYTLVDLWEDDPANYYKYSAYQAGSSTKLEYCYTGFARVKDYTRSNGKQSYQLIEMYPL